MRSGKTASQKAVSGASWPARSSSTPASLLENRNDEEAALIVFAELLDFVSANGLSSLASADTAAPLQKWGGALATLSHAVPLNGMLADTLLECVNTAFAMHLRTFQGILQQQHQQQQQKNSKAKLPSSTVVGPALTSLCSHYDQVFPLLQGWCAALGVPGVASFFSVQVRCALLQTDLISGEEPREKRIFFAFLRRYGHELLSRDPRPSSAEEGVDDEVARDTTGHASGSPCDSVVDPVIACLHRLTLSQSNEMKQLWRSVLEARIREKLRGLSDDFSTHFLHEQMAWLEQCVMPFVAMVLDVEGAGKEVFSSAHAHQPRTPGDRAAAASPSTAGTPTDTPAYATATVVDAEREAWCADVRHLFLCSYARRRLDRFWEILSDYPDSIPALEDMQFCLQASPESGLKTELIHTVRHLLSSRLHRAGTRTEDILAILINTIHAFCVLFPRNEQNSVVFAVIADTLEHLRKRKDCVTAIVQAVMQPNGAMNATIAAPLPLPSSSAGPVGTGEPFPPHSTSVGGVGDVADYFDGLHVEGLYRTGSRDRPDVLRVLLTSIHRRALVEEYQHVLAEQLLQKPLHEFDTTPEEEVLERLKQVFGETVLDKCAVMVRDMQMSRRITQQLREQLGRWRGGATSSSPPERSDAGSVAAAAAAGASLSGPLCSVSVLSMTTWPPLARCSAVAAGEAASSTSPLKYHPHPSLQAEMDRLAAAYKRLKDNQRLAWLPSLGRVELELTQLDPAKGNAAVTVSHVLSLFDASLVLFAKEMTNRSGEGTTVPLVELAAALEVDAEELRPHVQRLSPVVLVMPTGETVAVQRRVAASADFVFVEDAATGEADAKPAGLPPERVKLMERMVTSLLKTRGPQAGAAIHSSLKMLAKFEGTNADLLELLQSFIKRGLIVLNDAKLYALPPK